MGRVCQIPGEINTEYVLQDEDNMQEVLRHAAAMLGELRTSLLGPQKYYQLYVQVNDELRAVEAFFSDEPSKGRSFDSLYELVQHAGNVLPRLYLLCTVGACYIRSGQAPSKSVLKDMADMCKGVQHPTRGLFLRAYLVQECRGILPDTGTKYEGEDGGNIVDAVEFLLSNFTEMNKLWVRMKLSASSSSQGGGKNAELRERERSQLADLVGKNLTQLSQLEGLEFELYRDVVLPRVLEQVVACKDELAQGYLMQCIAAAFPDEFHVGTLEVLLDALPALEPGVKLATVMGSLLERLADYAAKQPSVIEELDSSQAFGKMRDAAAKSVAEHPDMPPSDLTALYAGLLSFAGAVYPERMDYVDDVLKTCSDALSQRCGESFLTLDSKTERQMMTLLSSPLERYGLLTVLELKHYGGLLMALSHTRRREMARRLGETALRSPRVCLDSVDKVASLFTLLGPLMSDASAGAEESMDGNAGEDAELLARLIHVLRSNDAHSQFDILEWTLPKLVEAGPIRAGAAIPPLCFLALEFVRYLTRSVNENSSGSNSTSNAAAEGDKNGVQRWYRFLHRAASCLAQTCRAGERALEIFLLSAVSASEEAKLEMMAYECFEKAFILFEEALPDTRQEVRALQSVVRAIDMCHVFDTDNREALMHTATSHCSKLLRRVDQCLAMLSCASMYWQQSDSVELENTTNFRRGEGVVMCLKRALKSAHSAQQQLSIAERSEKELSIPGRLFVEILNGYIYFFDLGVPQISADAVQSILELAHMEVATPACKQDEELQGFYLRSVAHLREKREAGGEEASRYSEIRIPG